LEVNNAHANDGRLSCCGKVQCPWQCELPVRPARWTTRKSEQGNGMTMKTKTTATSAMHGLRVGVMAGAVTLALAGCQTYDAALGSGTGVTATDSARLTRSGFLSDYARLKPVSAADGIECWRDPRLDAKRFDKVMISRIVV